MNPDQQIREAALRWAALTADPDFGDWDAFTAWLEQDAAHASAYDAVQFAIDEAAALLDAEPAVPDVAPAPANDNPPVLLAGRRWAWFGTAIAASLVVVATFQLWPGTRGEALYTTAPGETRLIMLDDGSTIALGGGSRIAIAGEGERQARLEAGQALFTIRHDATDPFVLAVGSETLVDAGTVFDVRMKAGGLDLAVSEGAVVVNPAAQALRVDAGRKAVLAAGRYLVSPVDPAEVGEWSRGRITFRDAGPAEVAAELSRATGIAFEAGSAGGAVRLSGSITLDQVRADPRSLEPILGMKVRREGEVWVISAR
ncbi:MAG: FecR family protein [Erythrobacter sp.]